MNFEFEQLIGMNCNYIKDLENPWCEVTKEMVCYWELMGLDVDVDPTSKHIIAACERGLEWSRDDRMWLGLSRRLNYKSSMKSSRKYFLDNLLAHVNNFVLKEFGEMYPKRDIDVEDKSSTAFGGMTKEHIEQGFKDLSDAMRDGFGMCLKEMKLLGDRLEAAEKKVEITKKGLHLMIFNSLLHIRLNVGFLTSSCTSKMQSENVNGAKGRKKNAQEPSRATEPSSSKELSLVVANVSEEKAAELSVDPSVIVLDKQEPTILDIHQEKVRRQTKKDAAMAFVRGKSDRARKLAASQQSPFQGNNKAKVIIPNTKGGPCYNLFAPVDRKMRNVLVEWLKLDPYYRTPSHKKPPSCPSLCILMLNLLRLQYFKYPHHFRSERMCFLDHVFSQMWTDKYEKFKSSKPDHNGLGRRLPGGAGDFYTDIISIPKKHLVIWDSIANHIKSAELVEIMESFLTMIPYLLVECVCSDEERVKYTLEPFTYERVTAGVPQCRTGDCGVYTLNYIEFHAFGLSFHLSFCDTNVKDIREKMALDIFQETPGPMKKRTKTMMRTWHIRRQHKIVLKVFQKIVMKVFQKTVLKVFQKTVLKVFQKTVMKVFHFSSYNVDAYDHSNQDYHLDFYVSPDHTLLQEEGMCVPQLVVQHKDIYSSSLPPFTKNYHPSIRWTDIVAAIFERTANNEPLTIGSRRLLPNMLQALGFALLISSRYRLKSQSV
ncbi:hypothetical protein N665_0027s0042 [Sinapis alba]|nr:hypothetical protein N665_0027s0042 [Sinapis alba]